MLLCVRAAAHLIHVAEDISALQSHHTNLQAQYCWMCRMCPNSVHRVGPVPGKSNRCRACTVQGISVPTNAHCGPCKEHVKHSAGQAHSRYCTMHRAGWAAPCGSHCKEAPGTGTPRVACLPAACKRHLQAMVRRRVRQGKVTWAQQVPAEHAHMRQGTHRGSEHNVPRQRSS